MAAGKQLSRELVATVRHSKGAIQMRMDVDAQSSITAAAGAGAQLEKAAVQLHGVIVMDGPLVLETADAVEVRGSWPPPGIGLRGGVGEAGIVARAKPVEDPLRLGQRAGMGEPEFDDEAILESAKEPFHPTLALGGGGRDPADPEFLEGAPDLRGLGAPPELFGQRQRGQGIAVEDAVAIGIGCAGQAVTPDELAEKEEIAMRIFVEAKESGQDLAGRVINRGEEH